MSGVISDAAETLQSVAERLDSLKANLADDADAIGEDLASLAADVGGVIAELRNFVDTQGEPQSVPQAAEVSNPPEPDADANTETVPEEGAEPVEGATVIENETGDGGPETTPAE